MITKPSHATQSLRCPKCGKIYSIDEIFLMSELARGNMVETYICDGCNTNLRILARIDYVVTAIADKKLPINETIINMEETNNEEE